jgi:hypothetical protein
MLLKEIFEQMIAPVPPGQGGILPSTQPTRSSTDTSDNKNKLSPKDVTNLRNNINNIKGELQKAGGGGNVDDVSKLVKVLGTDNDPNKPLNPGLAKSLQGIAPGFSDLLQNNQSAMMTKNALATGIQAKSQSQAQQDKEDKQKTIQKAQQTGQQAIQSVGSV